MAILFVFVCLLNNAIGYNNGIGKSPVMGWSTWNSYEASATETDVKANIDAILSRGFSDAGYKYICIDEGWIKSRSSNGSLLSDSTKYPSGMVTLGQYVHSKGLKYGLYSSRGTGQCGSADVPYSAPGSYGHYKQDAEYFANAGADFVKFDSCYATQDLAQSVAEYANMSQYLNATGRTMYYDLCGWHWYFGISGGKFSNSWRIDGDCNSWSDILTAMEISLSGVWKYGNPYGWNNHDMMFSTNTNSGMRIAHQTPLQARAQFSWYAAASSDLIISDIIPNLSAYDVETYTNKQVINVNQDNGPVNGPHSGYKILSGSTAHNNVTIFGKPLSDGSFAAVFLNSGGQMMNITCDEDCFLQQGFNESVNKLAIADLWSGKSLGVINRIKDYSANKFNGVVEIGMCTGSDDQIFKYDSQTNTIQSMYNKGYLQTYTCGTEQNFMTVVTTSVVDHNNGCNGNNALWDVYKVANSSWNCTADVNASFPVNLDGVQCMGLAQASQAHNEAECEQACCDKSGCTLYQWCAANSDCSPSATCWIGNNCETKGSETAWKGRGRNTNSYCNGYECFTICNKNYKSDSCLYIDSISGNDYPYGMWNDGTIREMKRCGTNMNLPNDQCRCLQVRPYIGVSSFRYTAINVPPSGGVTMLQFTPTT